MASTPKFGAALGSDTYTTKVDIEKKIETTVWKDKTGVSKIVKTTDPTTEIAVTIEADAQADFAPGIITTLPVTGISGGVVACSSVKYSETNDGKAATDISATHYPSAAVLGA